MNAVLVLVLSRVHLLLSRCARVITFCGFVRMLCVGFGGCTNRARGAQPAGTRSPPLCCDVCASMSVHVHVCALSFRSLLVLAYIAVNAIVKFNIVILFTLLIV